MKKTILGIAVIALAFFSMPALSAQENQNTGAVNTEVTADDYVQVNFNDLPGDIQEMLVKEFEGFEVKAIFQHIETKLLKVVAVKDEVEKTFIQNEEGKFVEQ